MTPTIKIVFELEPDEDGFPPLGSEAINATPVTVRDRVSDGEFILENTPFFVTGVALGDRVAARRINDAEGRFDFSHVLEPSSAKTVSIIFLADDLKEHIFQDLRGQGCYCEYGKFAALEMLAVSIPAKCDYDVLRVYLSKHENEGHISFAELAV